MSWEKALEVFHYNHVQSNAAHEGLETLKAFRDQASKFTAAQGSLSAPSTDISTDSFHSLNRIIT